MTTLRRITSLRRITRSSLAAACIAVSTAAFAVRLDPAGLGQALVYPYYTVRSANGNAFNSYLSVVNTRAEAKVVRVRFREGRNARPVLELNVYLGAQDVWTAAIVPSSADAGSPARLVTADVSCTDPAIPAMGVDFSSASYSGAASDGGGSGADRTREGFVEILELGTLGAGTAAAVTAQSPGQLPANCASVQGAGKPRDVRPPTGGLSGTASLINVNSGLDSTYDAAALADLTQSAFYADLGAAGADFNAPQVVPQSITLLAPGAVQGFGSSSDTYVLRSDWSRGVDAVSAVLMKSSIANEYILDQATLSATDWILTQPTASYYTGVAAPIAPYSSAFGSSGACEPMGVLAYNREQRMLEGPCTQFNFDSCPTPITMNLCWASNAMSWLDTLANPRPQSAGSGPSSVLGSMLTTDARFTAVSSQNGWATAVFDKAPAHVLTSLPSSVTIDAQTGAVVTAAQQYLGLPLVGFAMRTFNNGTLSCGGQPCMGVFSGIFADRYSQHVVRAP